MTTSNSQITVNLQVPMSDTEKVFDLEERTFRFSRDVALYCKKLPKTVHNVEYSKQGIRSSGSTGANYIEAREALSKKDFLLRIRIARKEAKETSYWLRLIVATNDEEFEREGVRLQTEAEELKKILSSMIEKSQ
jgi:four helix bundle protein